MADLSRIFRDLILMLFLISTISCPGYNLSGKTESGVYHRVRKGETINRIAQIYKVNPERIKEVNNIGKMDTIEADMVIFIPGAKEVVVGILPPAGNQVAAGASKKIAGNNKIIPMEEKAADFPKSSEGLKRVPIGRESKISENNVSKSVGEISSDSEQESDKGKIISKISPSKESAKVKEAARPSEDKKNIQYDRRRFLFPVKGKIISRFGIQSNGLYYNGIEISAKDGSEVIASAEGMVIFSDTHPLKDYGETIIMKHDDDYITVYTNLGKRLVKRDDHVKKGDMIAILAKPALKGDPIIHFEVRHKNKAINPLIFFPDL